MLSEREQSYYAELFQTCDVDGTGKFSGGQVSELFRASGLTQDVLLQVYYANEVTGILCKWFKVVVLCICLIYAPDVCPNYKIGHVFGYCNFRMKRKLFVVKIKFEIILQYYQIISTNLIGNVARALYEEFHACFYINID